jgi:uncharacterized protein YdaU (DUF1376 family)
VNYYKRHLGDYAKDTRHLSLAEHGAFCLMLDYYYATEKAIPDDRCERIANAYAPDERQAVRSVLEQFFTLTPEGWVNAKAESVIQESRGKSLKAKESAKTRWGNSQCERNANASEMECERNASHKPLATSHKEAKGQAEKLALPDWLPPAAWADWHTFRNAGKGWTPKARELSLATLTKLHAAGHQPRAVIEQSIERGWTGLFPLKATDQAAPSRRLKELV